jgi:hypothetical protein
LNTQRLRQAAFVACVLLFLAGIVQLFLLRFETGDVYPPYSSLRADPLGTRALYESLELEQDIKLSRSFQAFEKIRSAKRQTVFILGIAQTELEEMPAKDWQEIETLANGGTRVVITLYPKANWPRGGAGAAAKSKNPKDKKPEEIDPLEKPVSIKERWTCSFAYHGIPKETNPDGTPKVVLAEQQNGGEKLSWHTTLCFDELGPEWRVKYTFDGNPVIIERDFGTGTIVLSADSYFFSNEAMRAERHVPLLAWMIGPSNTIVFEESHLGVTESPGIASMARKYRLYGMVAALLLLVGLFAWQQSSPLLPPYEEALATEIVTARDAASGLLMLLRRGISARELIKTCLEQWRRTSRTSQRVDSKAKEAEAIANDSSLPPVEAYKRIARVLSKRAVRPGEAK